MVLVDVLVVAGAVVGAAAGGAVVGGAADVVVVVGAGVESVANARGSTEPPHALSASTPARVRVAPSAPNRDWTAIRDILSAIVPRAQPRGRSSVSESARQEAGSSGVSRRGTD